MILTPLESLFTIGVIALTTLLTRALTFVVFPADKKTPPMIEYLGKVLPFAIIGMLVVYALRHVNVMQYPYGIPEVIAGIFVVIIHKWKHNLMLSIGGGTVLYMVLVQWVIF
jgi:branched-subunit amino acid transport protein AzlD